MNKNDSVLSISIFSQCYNNTSYYAVNKFYLGKELNCLELDWKKDVKNFDTCYVSLNQCILSKLPEEISRNVKHIFIYFECSDCLGLTVFTSDFIDSFKSLKSFKIINISRHRKGSILMFLNNIEANNLEFLRLTIYKRKNLHTFPVEPFLHIKYLYFEYPNCYPFLGIGSKMIRSLRRFIEENPNLKAMEIPFNGRYLKKTAKERGIILNY